MANLEKYKKNTSTQINVFNFILNFEIPAQSFRKLQVLFTVRNTGRYSKTTEQFKLSRPIFNEFL